MPAQTRTHYARPQLAKVLKHIQQSLDQTLSLRQLSQWAGCSEYHFHRYFSACCGLSVGRYIRLLRLQRAGTQLLYRHTHGLMEIALQAGYTSAEAFSRSFKSELGQSPSHFRSQPDLSKWHELEQVIHRVNSAVTERDGSVIDKTLDVSIVDCAALDIALMIHRGHSGTLVNSLQTFIAWRKAEGLHPSRSRTFNLFYDDPEQTPEHDCRLGLGAELTGKHKAVMTWQEQSIQRHTMPAMRCARVSHRGDERGLEQKIRYLYGTWLKEQDLGLADYPLFLQRKVFFPDVAPGWAEVDIYLPLQLSNVSPVASQFRLRLMGNQASIYSK